MQERKAFDMPKRSSNLSGDIQRAIAVVTKDGLLLHCTQHVRSHFERFFPCKARDCSLSGKALPSPLAAWIASGHSKLPLVVETVSNRLEVHLFTEMHYSDAQAHGHRSDDPSGIVILLFEETALPIPAAPAALLQLGLTAREADVLFWLAHGKRNSEIAQLLGTADNTIKKHMQSVCGKLGVDSRLAAALRAAELLNLPVNDAL